MITEPKIEHRNEQPYVGLRAQVTMQELGKLLPPFGGCRTWHILVLTVFTVPVFAGEPRRRQTEDSSSESKLVPALGEIGCEGLTNSPLLRGFGLLLG